MIAPEIEAKLRSSVIDLHLADGSIGTVWVAKDNGVAVGGTRSVRWFAEGRMTSAGGELEIMAKAIHLDFATELAFLVPAFRIGLPPVTLGDDRNAKVGQTVFVIGSGLSAVGGTIATIDPARIELNATVGARCLGAPVIDEQGLVLGAVARVEGKATVIPISVIVRALAELEGEPAELFDRLPYRCADCGTMFGRADERCSGCGVPPSFGTPVAPDLGLATSARLLGSLLVRLGHDPTVCRVAPDRWQLDEVSIGLEQGVLRIGIPVLQVPPRLHEACYRFLLTYADQASDHLPVGIRGDQVVLQSLEPLELFGERELGARIQQLRDGAFRLRQTLPKALSGEVSAEPVSVLVGEPVPVLVGEPLPLEPEAIEVLPEAALALDLDDDLSLP